MNTKFLSFILIGIVFIGCDSEKTLVFCNKNLFHFENLFECNLMALKQTKSYEVLRLNDINSSRVADLFNIPYNKEIYKTASMRVEETRIANMRLGLIRQYNEEKRQKYLKRLNEIVEDSKRKNDEIDRIVKSATNETTQEQVR